MMSIPAMRCNRIPSPKLGRRSSGRTAWFPYYAGFSEDFIGSILRQFASGPKQRVLDPWNGSGTTAYVANSQGHSCVGIDANPVMVVAAKAKTIDRTHQNDIFQIWKEVDFPLPAARPRRSDTDPLDRWFTSSTSDYFREITKRIHKSEGLPQIMDFAHGHNLAQASPSLSFFYLALFRTVRGFLNKYITSNPTWIQRHPENKVRVSSKTILKSFLNNSEILLDSLAKDTKFQCRSEIILGTSESLPLASSSIDITVSSPPYCTRIDYVIKTLPELAVLGCSAEWCIKKLRARMVGTPTITNPAHNRPDIANHCRNLLQLIKNHKSHGSSNYYFPYYAQYFHGLSASLSEIARVTRPGGLVCLVVQDSYYKEIHVDLPSICVEMCASVGLSQFEQFNFPLRASLSGINSKSLRYRANTTSQESVLLFRRKA